MLITTTASVEGQRTLKYIGIVNGEAVIGVDIDFLTINKDMLMVSANGTAVKLAD